MPSAPALHRFEQDGRHFVIDPETCFCFECDAISRAVLAHYPDASLNRILHLLREAHPQEEIKEVIGELEWLRASKSILPVEKQADLPKRFELERGLRELSVELPEDAAVATKLVEAAGGLLLARSGEQQKLTLVLRSAGAFPKEAGFIAACESLLRTAGLAGKRLQLTLHCAPWQPDHLDPAFDAHSLALCLSTPDATRGAQLFSQMAALCAKPFKKALKGCAALPEAFAWEVILTPGQPDFNAAVVALHKGGCPLITLECVPAMMEAGPEELSAWEAGLEAVSVYYAHCLLRQEYFRLEPVAGLFHRIYEGAPLTRQDPAGSNTLAINPAGEIYPSPHFIATGQQPLGQLFAGSFDEERRRRFDDLGAHTTPECMGCWARHLCGGGLAAIHQARTGEFRRPDPAWCAMQQRTMESAIVAFNLLSSNGVNFSRLYSSLGASRKASLFTLARAALSMHLSLRPISEADAALLTQWENWNEAAYFLCNETGLFLATRYDREMDSLHPVAMVQEFMLLSRKQDPQGLLKLRPLHWPGVAQVWIYLRHREDYAAPKIRKSFRFLLEQAAGKGDLRHLLTPVGPEEPELAAFLEALNFIEVGQEREALFLHGKYHPVRWFQLSLPSPNPKS